MPTAVTLTLKADAPLLFDEAWPLEDLLLSLFTPGAPDRPTRRAEDDLKPYTLSPIRRAEGKRPPFTTGVPFTTDLRGATYQWRIGLLDDALTPGLLQRLEATPALMVDGQPLTISGVALEECAYPELARQAQAAVSAQPDEARQIQLEFLTPAVWQRSGLPMPLPDPPLVFQHYLAAWDTFAPRAWQINFNLLDAVAYHVAVMEHRLETRRVKLAGGGTRIGLLGTVSFSVMEWRKLGVEFVGHLAQLARYANWCGSGEFTANGLGQTRCRPAGGRA